MGNTYLHYPRPYPRRYRWMSRSRSYYRIDYRCLDHVFDEEEKVIPTWDLLYKYVFSASNHTICLITFFIVF